MELKCQRRLPDAALGGVAVGTSLLLRVRSHDGLLAFGGGVTGTNTDCDGNRNLDEVGTVGVTPFELVIQSPDEADGERSVAESRVEGWF